MSETTPVAADQAAPRKKPNVKAWLWGYAAFYVLMFVVYFTMLATRSESLAPAAWLERAGQAGDLDGWDGRLGGADIPGEDELAELYRRRLVEIAPPGPPTPGEIRFTGPYSFNLPDGSRRTVEEGQRLTRADVAALAFAIVRDHSHARNNAAAAEQKGMADLPVYRDNFLNSLDWNYWLSFGNLLGFFMLLYLFLWGPLRGALEGMAGKAAQGLARARAAEAEAADLRRRNDELREEMETRRRQLAESTATDVAEERDRLLEAARREADALQERLKSGMAAELQSARDRIKNDVVKEALDEARRLLEQVATPEDHHAAVRGFVADVEKAEFRS